MPPQKFSPRLRIAALFVAAATASTALPPASAAPLSDTLSAGPEATSADRVVISPGQDGARQVGVSFRLPGASPTAAIEFGEDGAVTSSIPVQRTSIGIGRSTYSAQLKDLRPETSYRYRIVGQQGAASQWETFTTASASDKPFEFLYFGDAQNGLDKQWRTTAEAGLAAAPDASLIVHGGDMVDTGSEKEWSDFWQAQQGANARIQTVGALGNHELVFDLTASKFKNAFTLPSNGPAPLDETTYSFDYQGVRFITLTGNGVFLDRQAKFLEQQLESNPNRWSVVVVHQPIYNGTERNYTDAYREAFGEIIEKYGVDLVLTGHDHTYGRGAKDGTEQTSGPQYVVATSGSKFFPTDESIDFWRRGGAHREVWAQETATFQKIRVEGCTMHYESVITHRGEDQKTSNGVTEPGDTLDQFTIDKCAQR